jgi:hypothetical protein
MGFKEVRCEGGDWVNLAQDVVVYCCDNGGNETSVSIKGVNCRYI